MSTFAQMTMNFLKFFVVPRKQRVIPCFRNVILHRKIIIDIYLLSILFRNRIVLIILISTPL